MTVPRRPGAGYLVKRALAALMDYALYVVIFIAYCRIFGEVNEEGSYQVNGCHHVLALFAVWCLMFPVSEVIWGRSIGKVVCGLRVAMRDKLETPPGIDAVVKRHVTALLEVGMCFGVLPLIVILSTPTRQRLGDLWAGTLVIDDDEPRLRPPNAADPEGGDPAHPHSTA